MFLFFIFAYIFITVQEKIEVLNDRLEKESLSTDKPNDVGDIENSSVKGNYSSKLKSIVFTYC